jgi:hypothetical protein
MEDKFVKKYCLILTQFVSQEHYRTGGRAPHAVPAA